MIYIYDILLNFCDNDLIYDFYEWDKNDDIENIKRVKLIHITKDTYDKVLKYNIEIDSDFLIKIFKTCEVYNKKKINILDYCCLFSDGERVIAIEFNNKGESIYKSKLLIDEENEIAVLASNLELTNINIKIKNKVLKNRFYTRNEIIIKKFLLKEIENSYRTKKYIKIKYLYQEYFGKNIKSYKQMKDELVKSIDLNIDDKHREIYNLLKLSTKKKQI